LKELALAKMYVRLCSLNQIKHFLQMMYVNPYNQIKDNNIVNVIFCEDNQNLIHDFSNFCKGDFQIKWQKLSLIRIIFPIRINPLECCFVTFFQWQLMVAKTQIQNVKHLDFPKGTKNFF